MEQRRRKCRVQVFRLGTGNAFAEKRERLCRSVEHQADSHACGEHHRNPGWRREFGFFIVAAQPDRAEPRERNGQNVEDEDRPEQDEHPTKVVDDPAQGVRGELREPVRCDEPPQDDGEHECCRRSYDSPVGGSVVGSVGHAELPFPRQHFGIIVTKNDFRIDILMVHSSTM